MSYRNEDYLPTSAVEATNSAGEQKRFKLLAYPIDRYVVYVELDEGNRFVGITEIRINKEFLSSKQKLASMAFTDVDEFYKD